MGERIELRAAQILREGLTLKDPDYSAHYAGEWLINTHVRQGLGILK